METLDQLLSEGGVGDSLTKQLKEAQVFPTAASAIAAWPAIFV